MTAMLLGQLSFLVDFKQTSLVDLRVVSELPFPLTVSGSARWTAVDRKTSSRRAVRKAPTWTMGKLTDPWSSQGHRPGIVAIIPVGFVVA